MIKIHFDIYCKINKTMPVALAQKLKKKKIQIRQNCLNSIIMGIFYVANTLIALILLCN